jgi:beta-lactam-binding protein with PASTA domain
MPRIFVSYRREDAEGEAGRLFDDLVNHFGEDSVFLDVAAIEVGRDFRKAIDESVATCGVLLAIIGRDWIDAKNEAGQRRLDDPSDFVRLETASALKRDIPVIPVLVHGAKMPRPDQLPDDLKELAFRNGVELTHARWRSDLDLLIKALRRHVEDPKNPEVSAPAAVEARVPVRPLPVPPLAVEDTVRNKDTPQAHWWKSRGAILAFVVGAAVVLAAGAYLLWPKKPAVPDLTGSTIFDATAKLQAATLVVGRKIYQGGAEKAADTVLSQSPLPNTRVKSGTAVDIVLVKRQASVEVPRLTGKSLDVAQTVLQDLRLAVGNVSREPRSDVVQDTVLDEFPKSGKKVESGTAIDLVVAQAQTQPAPVPPQPRPAPPQPSNVQSSLPNFAGTWRMFEETYNGEARTVSPQEKPLTITQNGTAVHIGRDLTITSAGTVTYRQFYVHDNQHGHEVATEDQADLVNTFTWRVKGSTLIFETTFDYKRPYYGHPLVKDLRIMKYHRIAP